MAFYIRQNDTSPTLQATLSDYAGDSINLNSASVQFHMKGLDGTMKVDSPMTISGPSDGIVQYEWSAGDTDTVGTYKVEFEVTYSDNTVETFPNNGYESVVVTGELN